MDTIEDTKLMLDKIKEQMDKAIDDAYTRGFDAGVATTPDHKQFHDTHKEAQWYGEDGEIVVVSGRYTYESAVNKIWKLLKPDYDTTKNEVAAQTNAEKIAIATDSDDECSYYASHKRTGIFDAWVWRA